MNNKYLIKHRKTIIPRLKKDLVTSLYHYPLLSNQVADDAAHTRFLVVHLDSQRARLFERHPGTGIGAVSLPQGHYCSISEYIQVYQFIAYSNAQTNRNV
jgi:hypothetical protein